MRFVSRRHRARIFLALPQILFVAATEAASPSLPPVQTIFIIVMENRSWSQIKDNPSAPYLNQVLLPIASYCEQYFAPPGLRPSEPNYLWLEAGTNFGIIDNNDPELNHQNTTNHLVAQLRNAGLSWKTYQEDIDGTYVPLTATNLYTPRHNPFVYFDDVTGTNNPADPYGIAHIRPYSQLASDLSSGRVARYNFIKPNLCHDTHDCEIEVGDAWLASEVPHILNSPAYQNAGALFITWDEGQSGDEGPIGLIVLSPFARGGGYSNNIYYTHSSTLRTFQELLGVTPLLGDAAQASNFSDLFLTPDLADAAKLAGGEFQFRAEDLIAGRSAIIQSSTNLVDWISVGTNTPGAGTFFFTDPSAKNFERLFYRFFQPP